jgi:hypothetical protein
MIKRILFFFTIFYSFTLSSQNIFKNTDESGNNWLISTGYYRTNYNILELNLGWAHTENENTWVDLRSYSAGVEVLFIKNNQFICPKIAYEYSFLIFNLRANLVYMNEFGNNALIFRPEVGLSAIGFFNVNYSYNLNILNETTFTQSHGIHLQLNIFLGGRHYYHPE